MTKYIKVNRDLNANNVQLDVNTISIDREYNIVYLNYKKDEEKSEPFNIVLKNIHTTRCPEIESVKKIQLHIIIDKNTDQGDAFFKFSKKLEEKIKNQISNSEKVMEYIRKRDSSDKNTILNMKWKPIIVNNIFKSKILLDNKTKVRFRSEKDDLKINTKTLNALFRKNVTYSALIDCSNLMICKGGNYLILPCITNIVIEDNIDNIKQLYNSKIIPKHSKIPDCFTFDDMLDIDTDDIKINFRKMCSANKYNISCIKYKDKDIFVRLNNLFTFFGASDYNNNKKWTIDFLIDDNVREIKMFKELYETIQDYIIENMIDYSGCMHLLKLEKLLKSKYKEREEQCEKLYEVWNNNIKTNKDGSNRLKLKFDIKRNEIKTVFANNNKISKLTNKNIKDIVIPRRSYDVIFQITGFYIVNSNIGFQLKLNRLIKNDK